MAAISTHPSLRTLVFGHNPDDDDDDDDLPSPFVKRDRTDAVADMLLTNHQVDNIPFDDQMFDQDLWDALVVPRVEYNLYRKRLAPLQKIEVPSTRTAVVGSALPREAGKPSLVWMLLSQNRDVLHEYLDNVLTGDGSVSVTSRKRSRSSCRDDTCAP
jgi:hypothetical protein